MKTVQDLGFGRVIIHQQLAPGEKEHAETCPQCRGYRLESSWCSNCNGSGIVMVKDKAIDRGCGDSAAPLSSGAEGA